MRIIFLSTLALCFGCGVGKFGELATGAGDGARDLADAMTSRPDAGLPADDVGLPRRDGDPPLVDSQLPRPDGEPPLIDSQLPRPDGGPPPVDSAVDTPRDCDGLAHGETETRVRYEASTVAYGASCKEETQTRRCDDGALSSWSGSFTATSCRVAPWEKILAERVGFGRHAKGGSGGPLCDVTNLDDSGPGSLRACAEASGPLWIRFKVSGKIVLSSNIRVRSQKTIDGRGASITITQHGLNIDNVSHVIVHNLRFDEGGSGDAITVTEKSQHIWIDHVHLEEYGDGLIDIKRESTDVTVSWCRFEDHDKVMLIGHDVSHAVDAIIRVTLHHNYFRKTTQRHPRLRFGKVHAFNNYLHGWKLYGMVVQMGGQILSERNIFEPSVYPERGIVPIWDDPQPGYVESRDEWLINGAKVIENDSDKVFEAKDYYQYALEKADSTLRSKIEANTGRLSATFPQ